MKHRLLVLLLLSAYMLSLKAPVTIPTPNTATLAQYGVVPMSLHTGKANISIPLLDVTARGVKLSASPYAYCHNNPANRIDPDGRNDYF